MKKVEPRLKRPYRRVLTTKEIEDEELTRRLLNFSKAFERNDASDLSKPGEQSLYTIIGDMDDTVALINNAAVELRALLGSSYFYFPSFRGRKWTVNPGNIQDVVGLLQAQAYFTQRFRDHVDSEIVVYMRQYKAISTLYTRLGADYRTLQRLPKEISQLEVELKGAKGAVTRYTELIQRSEVPIEGGVSMARRDRRKSAGTRELEKAIRKRDSIQRSIDKLNKHQESLQEPISSAYISARITEIMVNKENLPDIMDKDQSLYHFGKEQVYKLDVLFRS